MNARNDRLLRAACTALTAALMAGCAACMVARALDMSASWAAAYLLALAAAAAVQLLRRGVAWTLGVLLALVAIFGALLAVHVPKIAAFVRMLPEGSQAAGFEAARAAAGRGVTCLGAFLLGALLAGLLRVPSGAPFALMVLLTAVICALASDAELSLWAALPGLAAGVAAFGLPSDARRDGVPPALLIPAALLAALALTLTPGARITWEPLERLADQVRSIVEDYVRFTEERMAFSIGEKGYDRAGMIGENVVSMLGGPANPTNDAVMRVETDADLLLRGTIKRSYTGYSWVDDQAKARYLYYDFTHRRVRASAFDADTNADNPAFRTHSARVEMLESGTSTLFVPAQLCGFEMDLRDAVYYNSAGEIFLTRDVRAGDRYELSARLPVSEAALIEAAAAGMDASDAGYAEAQANYTALPPGIDTRVYSLAVELTQDRINPAEKALAIQDYLAQNCRYTLDGGYPEEGADFVSWFLLDAQEGYCSYFASAMAVMCRIAGLPARYVEGYSVEAAPGGETIVTGEDAHAWVEVYLNGLGWVAFDPTARARERQGQDGMEQDGLDASAGSSETPAPTAPENGELAPDAPSPSPSLEPNGAPTPTPDAGGAPDSGEATPEPGESSPNPGEPSPSPTPEDGELPPEDNSSDSDDPFPPEEDESAPDMPPDEPERESNLAWLWVLLILLALAALIWWIARWAKRRLRQTDPLALTARPEDLDEAALVLYRATLTLLNQLGYAPQSGETPVAFAARASEALKDPEYLRFARGVARCRYAGERANVALVRDGRRAYAQLLRRLSRAERLRFHARRMLHGLGSTEAIP